MTQAAQTDPLASVGVPGPGGRPATQLQYAAGWAELAGGLREHQQQLEALLAQAPAWQDETSAAFRDELTRLAESSSQAADTAESTARAQLKHAGEHERALEILRELAIQIAVTLAFIAASSFFPLVLAVAKVQLILLGQTAGRVVSLLVRLLTGLERTLVAVQGALQRLGELALRTESFSVGYGRFLADGIRDFTIDLLANSTTSAITHKPLSADSLLTSAGVSFGMGGLFGGLESSSAKKLLGLDGQVRRNADGLPRFDTLGQRYRRTVEHLGDSLLGKIGKIGKTGRTGEGDRTGTTARTVGDRQPGASAGTAALAAAVRANSRAGALGIGTGPAAARRLSAALDTARVRRAAAVAAEAAGRADRREAELLAGRTGDGVGSARDLLTRAGAEMEEARWLRDVHAAGGDAVWLRDAEHRLTAATGRYDAAQQHLADARALHERARQTAHHAGRLAAGHEARVARAADAHRSAGGRLAAWHGMATSAAQARAATSVSERISYASRHNDWRAAFGSPSGWRSAILYDGVKDGGKGFLSGLVQSGIAAGQGSAGTDSVWKGALLGAAGGAARGVVKGKLTNVAFLGGGVEEMLWKGGTKGLDKFVRDHIMEILVPSQPNPVEPLFPAEAPHVPDGPTPPAPWPGAGDRLATTGEWFSAGRPPSGERVGTGEALWG